MSAYARASDPSTSHEAAKAASLSHSIICAEIEKVLLLVGENGMTTHELGPATQVPLWSVSPRMKPMEKALRVCRTERRRINFGSTKKSTVWVARKFATDAERAASDMLYPSTCLLSA